MTPNKEGGCSAEAGSCGCSNSQPQKILPASSSSSSPVSDIEDVFKDEVSMSGSETTTTVKIHTRRKAKVQQVDDDDNDKEDNNDNVNSNDINPEAHKIFMHTWGCSHNTSDSEYMAGLLSRAGFKISKDKAQSSVWILNSCTVKGPSEQHFKNEVEEGRSLDKKVIVSGCVPQGAPKSEYIKGLSVIGVKQIDEIVNVVEETLRGNTVRMLSFTKKNGVSNGLKNPPGASLNFPKIRKNELIEIIPISTGCLNTCTYCKTKLARGNLSSYPLEEIVSRATQVMENEGVKEIWLTSEDLGAYGIDIGITIVDLLQELVKCLEKNPVCMLRLGMTNPPYILDHIEEIAQILNHPQVYGFLHIPIQAGSDSVLLEMKREYTRKNFEHIVNYLRAQVPSLTIATDIICGFPTELEEDFEESVNLVEQYKFPVLYINQFYPRPGTVAAKMPRLSTKVVKARQKRLTELFLSYTPYDNSRIGQIYRGVLVTEISHDKLHFVGHNKAYEQILIKQDLFKDASCIMGKKIDVKVVSVSKFSMIALPLDKETWSLENLVIFGCLLVLVLIAISMTWK